MDKALYIGILMRYYHLSHELGFLYFCLDRAADRTKVPKSQGCDKKAKFQYVALKTSKTRCAQTWRFLTASLTEILNAFSSRPHPKLLLTIHNSR